MDVKPIKISVCRKICAQCKNTFLSHFLIQPFCSEKCESVFNKERSTEEIFRLKTDQYCTICKMPYKPKGYKTTCSDHCEKTKEKISHEFDKKRHDRSCKCCGTKLRVDNHTVTSILCFSCSKQNEKLKRKEIAKPYIQQWIDKKTLIPANKKSYETLIKQSEYKRVFGKNAWDHFERGKRYDKI